MRGWRLTVARMSLALGSLCFVCCDFGPWASEKSGDGSNTSTDTDLDTGPDPDDYKGPRILSVWPEPGATNIPRDLVIRMKFSGHLEPSTVAPKVFRLYSGPNGRWITTSYDPVLQELRVWPSPALGRKAEWVLELAEGLEGLEGGGVAPGEVTRFRTSEETTGRVPIDPPSYSKQIEPLLGRSCVSCHSAGSRAAGLVLDSPQAIASTAVSRRSTGWPRFDRIESARPDWSYLIFKIMGWKGIAGRRMPSSLTDVPAQALTEQEQRLLSDWIAVGLPFVDPQDTDS